MLDQVEEGLAMPPHAERVRQVSETLRPAAWAMAAAARKASWASGGSKR